LAFNFTILEKDYEDYIIVAVLFLSLIYVKVSKKRWNSDHPFEFYKNVSKFICI